MKTRTDIHEELRHRILALSGVAERPNAGIHEDAFFVGGKMFMHIHGHGHCDIRLAKSDQARVLAEGKARPHRWAPEKGYVTFVARGEETWMTRWSLCACLIVISPANRVDEIGKRISAAKPKA